MGSSRSIRPFSGFNSKQGHVHNDIEPFATHNMSVLGRRGAGLAARGVTLAPLATASYLIRPFSALNRPPPKYPGHVPLTFFERGALAVGSAVGSLMNPRRAGKKFYSSYKNYQPKDLLLMLGEANTASSFRSHCGFGRSHCYSLLYI